MSGSASRPAKKWEMPSRATGLNAGCGQFLLSCSRLGQKTDTTMSGLPKKERSTRRSGSCAETPRARFLSSPGSLLQQTSARYGRVNHEPQPAQNPLDGYELGQSPRGFARLGLPIFDITVVAAGVPVRAFLQRIRSRSAQDPRADQGHGLGHPPHRPLPPLGQSRL